MKTLKQLKKKAWTMVSIRVRSKDADWRGYTICFTCGTVKHWKELDAGHYIHNKLDYDLRNLRPQCSRCNRFLHGNLGVYGEILVTQNGMGWVKKLRIDAQSKGNNYTRDELEKIIEKYAN